MYDDFDLEGGNLLGSSHKGDKKLDIHERGKRGSSLNTSTTQRRKQHSSYLEV